MSLKIKIVSKPVGNGNNIKPTIPKQPFTLPSRLVERKTSVIFDWRSKPQKLRSSPTASTSNTDTEQDNTSTTSLSKQGTANNSSQGSSNKESAHTDSVLVDPMEEGSTTEEHVIRPTTESNSGAL